MYVRPNYASRKLFEDAVKAGDHIEAFFISPGHRTVVDGILFVEGPHYSDPAQWRAQVKVEAGKVVKVIS